MIYQDRELVAKITAGNIHAFRLLVSQHERLVLRLVGRMVKDEADRADIVQEVFIKVYKHLNKFSFQSKLSTWIGQIAYTTALDHLKKNKKFEKHGVLSDADYVTSPADNPEKIVDEKEMRIFIRQAIERLPTQYQLVVTLFHMEDLPYQEIAEITGMPESSVKSNLFRARKLLKEQLCNLMG